MKHYQDPRQLTPDFAVNYLIDCLYVAPIDQLLLLSGTNEYAPLTHTHGH